jgi:hypothetical protein
MIPQINGRIENEGMDIEEIDVSKLGSDDIRKLAKMFRECTQCVQQQQQALKEAKVIIKHLQSELQKARG